MLSARPAQQASCRQRGWKVVHVYRAAPPCVCFQIFRSRRLWCGNLPPSRLRRACHECNDELTSVHSAVARILLSISLMASRLMLDIVGHCRHDGYLHSRGRGGRAPAMLTRSNSDAFTPSSQRFPAAGCRDRGSAIPASFVLSVVQLVFQPVQVVFGSIHNRQRDQFRHFIRMRLLDLGAQGLKMRSG